MFSAKILLSLALAIISSLAVVSCDEGDDYYDGPENKLVDEYKSIDLEELLKDYTTGRFNTKDLTYDKVGYDLHYDYYFFNFDRKDFAREKFAKPKIIVAGQNDDYQGVKAPKSIYPFAILQKAPSNPLYGVIRDTITDRFDVKSDKHGNQYFGLYDGHHGNRVVNQVRGMLLKKTVNAVKDKLPILDKVTHVFMHENESGDTLRAAEKFADLLKKEITDQIKDVFRQVDRNVQEGKPDTALSGAAASVVIVTKYNIIVANLGTVRVLTYDQDMKIKKLTNDHSIHNPSEVAEHFSRGYSICPKMQQMLFESCSLTRSIGSTDCKVKGYHEAEPEVSFASRYFLDDEDRAMETQFIVMQTSSVSDRIDDKEVKANIIRAVQQYRDQPHLEQAMYHDMVQNILGDVLRSPSQAVTKDMTDYSLMVIGLEKDNYHLVH